MSASAVARLSTPGEILAVLPSLCGFPPDESLVLLSLRGPRRRVGLTARVDLPGPVDEPAVAQLCAERMAGDGAAAVVLAVHSEQGRREGFVELVRRACTDVRLEVVEALHVEGGLWTSYSCRRACCPPTGTPLPTDSPALALVAAERVGSGRAVLRSRAELVASLAPPEGLLRAAADQRLEEAGEQWLRHRLERGAAASRRGTLDHAEALLDRVARGGPVAPVDAALLSVGLQDVQARDGLATLLLTRSDELLALLLQVASSVTPPADAPVCTLLAWVGYARGDGALANVALDRALEGTPDYSLALLLRTCLDAGIPPDEVRDLARGTRETLQRQGARRGWRR
jgi:hypothetical protein